MNKKEVDFWYWLVSKLPIKLVYFCFMSVMAHATTGKYSDTIVPELSGMKAILRFENDKNLK